MLAVLSAERATAQEVTEVNFLEEKDRSFSPGLIVDADAAVSGADGATPLILMVTVNGMDQGLAQFHWMDGEIWATPETLREIGIAIDRPGNALVALSAIEGVSATYHSETQSLDLMVSEGMLDLPTTRVNIDPEGPVEATRSSGLVLNYDAFANLIDGDIAFDGFTDLRYFNGNSILENTALFRLGGASGGRDRLLRLESGWTRAFPERRMALRLGDTVTVPSRWARSVRMGGLQIGTQNRLQPYLNTAPLPSFVGSTDLPSNVDLYIDGIRRYSGDLPAGPFEIGSGPSRINGAGQAELVLTDIFGRVRTLSFQLYDTQLLLRRGLSDWSVEVGAARENFGLESFDYDGDVFASGTLRHGLTNRVTLEGHAEGAGDFGNGGVGVAFLLRNLGVVSGSLAASTLDGRSGHQWGLGYSWTDTTFRLSADITRASKGYADLATVYGAPFPRERDLVQAGYSSRRFGTVGLSYVNQRYEDERADRFLSLNWFKPLSRDLFLNLTARTELKGPSNDSLFVTLTYSAGRRRTAGASLQLLDERSAFNLTARQSSPLDGGLGWNADAWISDGDFAGLAQAEYLSDAGEAGVGLSVRDEDVSGFLSYRGSLVLMDDHLFASRQIYDGFAVVSTEGTPDVPVLLHNRVIGKSGRSGRLLVTGLNAHQRNRIAIDPTDLPAFSRVSLISQDVVPADRAGVAVRFEIRPDTSLLLTLVDEAGEYLPMGSTARYPDADGPLYVTGFDGQIFIEDAKLGQEMIVEGPESECLIVLPAEISHERAGRTGPITCRPGQEGG